jgi:hypothetical protein
VLRQAARAVGNGKCDRGLDRKACGHAVEVDPAPLASRLGRERAVYGVWTSLKCGQCGASGKRRGDLFAMATFKPVPMGLGRPD